MANGLKYIKKPRSVTQYTLMKGVTDYSNLKQFDMFESGYGFLTVINIPEFMVLLAKDDERIAAYADGFAHIMEGEFKGLSGLTDITAEPGTITNGVNDLQLIQNVTMDTSITVSMEFYERSGGIITNFLSTYLTGIKDPYSKAKTYHGLVGTSIFDPGPEYETFTFLYYVTDNTMRNIEKAYLLVNAQPTTAPLATLYNVDRSNIAFQPISVDFNCFPIVGDTVNKYAAMMLEYDLTTDNTARKLILDSNDYQWDAYKNKVESSTRQIGSTHMGTILRDEGKTLTNAINEYDSNQHNRLIGPSYKSDRSSV